MSDDRRSELLVLADRCEREEPSRELDIAIWSTLNKGIDSTKWIRFADFGHSLDAAVTLVPEGWVWRCGAGMSGYADIGKLGLGFVDNNGNPLVDHTWAKTPAYALCAAALRARAAITDRGDT